MYTTFTENYIGEKEIHIGDNGIAVMQYSVLYNILTGSIGYQLISGKLPAYQASSLQPDFIKRVVKDLMESYVNPDLTVEGYYGDEDAILYCEMPDYILEDYLKMYCKAWQCTEGAQLNGDPIQIVNAVLNDRNTVWDYAELTNEVIDLMNNQSEWEIDSFIKD